jgi:hypothetical protein
MKRHIKLTITESEDKAIMQYLSDNCCKLATLTKDLLLKKIGGK